MALTITGIDPTDWAESADTSYNFYGPVLYLGALYTWGFTRRLAASVNVFKSINGGATWTVLTPPTFVTVGDSLSAACYDAAHHKIILMTSDSGIGNTGIYFIDCVLAGASGTDSFSAPYATGGPNNGVPEHVLQLSTGDIVVILGDGTANNNRLWAKFSIIPATWSGTVAVTTASHTVDLTAAVLDNADNVYVFWPANTTVDPVPCSVRSVSSSGTPSSITDLSSISMTGAGPIENGAFWTGNSKVNVYFKLESGVNVFPNRLDGTGTSWSNDSISALIGSDFGQLRVNGSGQLVADFIGGAAHFDSGLYTSVFNGATWPAPTLVYDCTVSFPANLTPPIGGFAFMSGVSANDNGWIVVMQAHDPIAGQDRTTLVSILNPIVPSITCRVPARVP